MSLQAFSFPVSETRILKAGIFIYNLNIIAGSSFSGDETVKKRCYSHELENIVRTVLANLDRFQPFSSTNFIVFPYKKQWEGVSQIMCKHCWRGLKAYPYILILYLEKNVVPERQPEKKLVSQQRAAWQPHPDPVPPHKRRKSDLPLEDAILPDLMPHLEAEGNVPVLGLQCGNWFNLEKVGDEPIIAGKTENKRSDVQQKAAATSSITGSGAASLEMQAESTQGVAEAEDADQDHSDAPVQPGILSRLARSIFPSSLFLAKPKVTHQTHIQN